MVPLPADLHVNATLGPSVDEVSGPSCVAPANSCARWPLHVLRNATTTVRLSWLAPSDDLDLYLRAEGQVVAHSTSAAGTIESLHAVLEAGDYEIVVSGSTTTGATFQLDAWFTEPRPGAAPAAADAGLPGPLEWMSCDYGEAQVAIPPGSPVAPTDVPRGLNRTPFASATSGHDSLLWSLHVVATSCEGRSGTGGAATTRQMLVGIDVDSLQPLPGEGQLVWLLGVATDDVVAAAWYKAIPGADVAVGPVNVTLDESLPTWTFHADHAGLSLDGSAWAGGPHMPPLRWVVAAKGVPLGIVATTPDPPATSGEDLTATVVSARDGVALAGLMQAGDQTALTASWSRIQLNP